jgi:hypothetical protein
MDKKDDEGVHRGILAKTAKVIVVPVDTIRIPFLQLIEVVCKNELHSGKTAFGGTTRKGSAVIARKQETVSRHEQRGSRERRPTGESRIPSHR